MTSASKTRCSKGTPGPSPARGPRARRALPPAVFLPGCSSHAAARARQMSDRCALSRAPSAFGPLRKSRQVEEALFFPLAPGDKNKKDAALLLLRSVRSVSVRLRLLGPRGGGGLREASCWPEVRTRPPWSPMRTPRRCPGVGQGALSLWGRS